MPARGWLRSVASRVLSRYGWDTGVRNLVAAETLRPFIRAAPHHDKMVLDVGCGPLGLAAFLPDVGVVGVDIDQQVQTAANFTFQPGDITALPFGDRAFPFVSSVDVLEHLPIDVRRRAIGELMRVADRGFIVACPHGENAERCDRDFRDALAERGKETPPWLEEHLRQPYPTVSGLREDVRAAANATGREVAIEVAYCEWHRLSRLVRASAVTSSVAYSAVNLALGAAFPLLPVPGASESYRVILVGMFVP